MRAGDALSNIRVILAGPSNIEISTQTWLPASVVLPSNYVITGSNTLLLNRTPDRLDVVLNNTTVIRTSNASLPAAFSNGLLRVTASNGGVFRDVTLQGCMVHATPSRFLAGLESTSIRAPEITGLSQSNASVLAGLVGTSNLLSGRIDAASNAAGFGSNLSGPVATLSNQLFGLTNLRAVATSNFAYPGIESLNATTLTHSNQIQDALARATWSSNTSHYSSNALASTNSTAVAASNHTFLNVPTLSNVSYTASNTAATSLVRSTWSSNSIAGLAPSSSLTTTNSIAVATSNYSYGNIPGLLSADVTLSNTANTALLRATHASNSLPNYALNSALASTNSTAVAASNHTFTQVPALSNTAWTASNNAATALVRSAFASNALPSYATATSLATTTTTANTGLSTAQWSSNNLLNRNAGGTVAGVANFNNYVNLRGGTTAGGLGSIGSHVPYTDGTNYLRGPLVVADTAAADTVCVGTTTAQSGAKMTISGRVHPTELRIGNLPGAALLGNTTLTYFASGKIAVGASSTRTVTIVIDGNFPEICDIYATPVVQDVNDSFSVTVRYQSTTQIALGICRVDSSGGWTASMSVNVMVIGRPI
jgi:hypothetical protein